MCGGTPTWQQGVWLPATLHLSNTYILTIHCMPPAAATAEGATRPQCHKLYGQLEGQTKMISTLIWSF